MGQQKNAKFTGQRARKDEDKEKRRAAILQAARVVFGKQGWSRFDMSAVAARAGIVKGTLYLYWATREELLLSLLENALGGWLDELDARLDHAPSGNSGALGAKKLAAIFMESLLDNALMLRLLAVLQTVLEHNVARASIERFKRFLLLRLAATGARLESRLPMLAAGEGVRLLLHLNALVSGLQQMAETAPLVEEVLRASELAPLRIDLPRELRAALETFFIGIENRRRK